MSRQHAWFGWGAHKPIGVPGHHAVRHPFTHSLMLHKSPCTLGEPFVRPLPAEVPVGAQMPGTPPTSRPMHAPVASTDVDAWLYAKMTCWKVF